MCFLCVCLMCLISVLESSSIDKNWWKFKWIFVEFSFRIFSVSLLGLFTSMACVFYMPFAWCVCALFGGNTKKFTIRIFITIYWIFFIWNMWGKSFLVATRAFFAGLIADKLFDIFGVWWGHSFTCMTLAMQYANDSIRYAGLLIECI